jgi:hypothetical protein
VALLRGRGDLPDVAAEPRQPVHRLGHLQLRELRGRRSRRVHARRLGVAPDGVPRMISGGVVRGADPTQFRASARLRRALRQIYWIVIGGVNGA